MKLSIDKKVAIGMLVSTTAEITAEVTNKSLLIIGASNTPALADEEFKQLGKDFDGLVMAVHGVPSADQLDDDTFLGMVNSLYTSYAEVDRSSGARRDYMKRWLEVEAAEEVPEQTPQQQPVRTLAAGELEDEPPVTTPAYFEPGRYEGISNDAYHSANGVSSTQVKDARISLMYYHGRHVARTIKKESTEALTFGSLVHAMVLEPEKLAEEFSVQPVIPEGAFTGTESMTKWLKEYNASLPPLLSSDEIKALLEAHNVTLTPPLSLGGSSDDVGNVYTSLPEQFQTIPKDGKFTATAMKACIKEYNATLPQPLKTSGSRETLLEQLAIINPELVEEDRAKPVPLNTSGTKDEISERIKTLKPDAQFADEIFAIWNADTSKIQVTRQQLELATSIQQAVFNHPSAGGLVNNPNRAVEVSYFGMDEDTGLDVRVRPDMEIDFNGIRVCFDLKTVSLGRIKQEALRAKLHRTIIDMDYHVSAAMYCDVADMSQFFWIFVNKDDGYHWIAIVEASEDELELGRLEYKKALRDIQNAQDTGIWPAPITSELVDELNDFDLRRLESLRLA
ncbi:PD-(D/E)XK nuclease-like domain-containing protein [Ewingella sp. AOP9-I1-14]